jgi:hypothetical protein
VLTIILQGITAEISWSSSLHDQEAHAAIQALGEDMRRVAEELGVLLDFVPPGNANCGQHLAGAFKSDDLKRFEEVRNAHDRLGVFQKLKVDGCQIPGEEEGKGENVVFRVKHEEL